MTLFVWSIFRERGQAVYRITEETVEALYNVIELINRDTGRIIPPPKRPKGPPKGKSENPIVEEVIKYLNEVSGKSFSPKTKATVNLINARVAEDNKLEDFKHVIDVKTGQWKNTDMSAYLRPTTLFNATKFESYKQEKIKVDQLEEFFTRHSKGLSEL